MDPRLVAMMQMMQKKPVQRFDGGDYIPMDDGTTDDILSSIGEDVLQNMDFSSIFGDTSDADLTALFGGDQTGGNEPVDIGLGGTGGEKLDFNSLMNLARGEDPSYMPMEGNRLSPAEQYKAIMQDLGYAEGEIPLDKYGRLFPFNSTEQSKYDAAVKDLRSDSDLGRFAAPGYGDLGQFLGGFGSDEVAGDKALSEMEVPQYDETLSPYKDIYDAYMQGASLDSEGKFNAARDSQAANEYLERVMGVPRSEIDAAYASAMPRFVNLSNFQGGKSFETGVDRYGNPIGTPGREVKYDKNGNIVDAKTGTVIEKAPAGTTSKAIQDILRQYTGGGTGTGSSSNMSWLIPLLLMMMAMNRNQQSSGQAVIPKLSAERTSLPYQQVQQAPGYRPGQGGVRYVSDVQYKPMAAGGIAALAGGGKGLLHGPGDGVSDSIPAMIGSDQPARLARGEYVVDARTVAELGNGSTDAGAERLDEMRQRVLSKRKQAKMGQDTKAYRHLPS
jgi:hypothetical protein